MGYSGAKERFMERRKRLLPDVDAFAEKAMASEEKRLHGIFFENFSTKMIFGSES